MKNKILAMMMVIMTSISFVPALSPVALADNGHGKEVSEFAKSFKATKGEHGRQVSELARSGRNGDDDENDDNDNNNRGRGNGMGNIGNIDARVGQLEALIARLQALLAELLRLRGGETDTAAPVISAVSAAEIKATEAKILWTTNEFADSKVYFSTSSPVNLASSSIKSKGGLDISHSVSLDGLAASTTYFYVVESKDRAGNMARSSQFSFTTSASAPAAPVISAIGVSSVSSSSAIVGWTTDKAATSKVYFSTSSPVNITTALSAANPALVLSHSIPLGGLTASSTYFFIVESADADGRVSRSGQSSFVTLP